MSRFALAALVLLAACRRDNDPPKDLADDTGGYTGDYDTGDYGPIVADHSGSAGAIGALEWYSLIGGYWEGGSVPFGLAWWGLIEPRDFHYRSLYGGQLDACVANPSFGTLGIYQLGVPETSISSAGAAISLQRADDGFYEATLSAAQVIAGERYDLDAVRGGALPNFAIEGLAMMPAQLNLSAPALSSAEVVSLSREDMQFAWTPAGADEVYIQLDLTQGEEVFQTVGCVVADDGSFTVPAELWEGWAEGEWIYVYVGAALEGGGGVVPLNNSQSRVMGIWWSMGAALSR